MHDCALRNALLNKKCLQQTQHDPIVIFVHLALESVRTTGCLNQPLAQAAWLHEVLCQSARFVPCFGHSGLSESTKSLSPIRSASKPSSPGPVAYAPWQWATPGGPAAAECIAAKLPGESISIVTFWGVCDLAQPTFQVRACPAQLVKALVLPSMKAPATPGTKLSDGHCTLEGEFDGRGASSSPSLRPKAASCCDSGSSLAEQRPRRPSGEKLCPGPGPLLCAEER